MENAESQIVVKPRAASLFALEEDYRDADKIVYTLGGVRRDCLSTIKIASLHARPNEVLAPKVVIDLPKGVDLSSVGGIFVSASKDGRPLLGREKTPIRKLGTGKDLVERTNGLINGAVSALIDFTTYDSEDSSSFLTKTDAFRDGIVAEITFLLRELGDDEDLEEVVRYRKWSAEKLVGIVEVFWEKGCSIVRELVMGDKKSE